MRIGIYKVGKPILFKENEEDHASWSIEVINIIKIFARRGHEMFILSETDYDGNEYQLGVPTHLDRIYCWNGPGDNPDLPKLASICKDIRLIITDMALIPYDRTPYTQIYTQSVQLPEYGAIEQAALLDFVPEENVKDVDFYFGGTERNRTADFLEYVYRPGQLWHGKSETLNIRNYIPFHEHVALLRRTKYTIVIGDERYNANGFVTPRYYECLRYGVLPFVDNKFDVDNLIPVHEFLYVTDYVQMIKKMKYLEEYPGEREKILKEAYALITPEMINGDIIYSKLYEI
jgi:hypothetical protein